MLVNVIPVSAITGNQALPLCRTDEWFCCEGHTGQRKPIRLYASKR